MEFRANQEQVINQIVDYFNQGVKTVILNAPTGSGKTIINLFASKKMGGSYYSTPLRVLVDQIRNDISGKLYEQRLGWSIMGRGAYKCDYLIDKENEQYNKDMMRANTYLKQQIQEEHNNRLTQLTADGATCTSKNPVYKYNGLTYTSCPFLNQCGYYNDREKAINSTNIVTTLDYLLVGILPQLGYDDNPYNIGWTKRPVLVIDEAHYLPSKLADFFSINISKKSLPDFDYVALLKSIEQYGHEKSINSLMDILPGYKIKQMEYLGSMEYQYENEEDDPLINYFGHDLLLSIAISKQRKLVNRLNNIINNLQIDDVEWIFNHDDNGIYWKPYSPKKFMEKFWKMFDHIILSSATFFGIEDYLDDLGLSDNYKVITMDSTFNADLASIIQVSSIKLNKGNFNTTIDDVVKEIDNILDKEKGKGIIHCQTYNYKNSIESLSRYKDRFITHQSNNRSNKLNEFIQDKTDKVLLSVNMGEGIDLKDDLARFQIIVKAPYPFLGDPWTKIHFDRSKQWYNNQTVIQIMQMCGRIIRSKDDWGTTYLIDKNISDLLNRSELPQYFKDRIDAGLRAEKKRLDDEFDELFKF